MPGDGAHRRREGRACAGRRTCPQFGSARSFLRGQVRVFLTSLLKTARIAARWSGLIRAARGLMAEATGGLSPSPASRRASDRMRSRSALRREPQSVPGLAHSGAIDRFEWPAFANCPRSPPERCPVTYPAQWVRARRDGPGRVRRGPHRFYRLLAMSRPLRSASAASTKSARAAVEILGSSTTS